MYLFTILAAQTYRCIFILHGWGKVTNFLASILRSGYLKSCPCWLVVLEILPIDLVDGVKVANILTTVKAE